MTTIPITSSTTSTGTPAKAAAGSTALTSSDFMNLMLKQLQNQDPLNPTDSNQLLQQISQISNLQSNQSLQSSLAALTLQQSIGAAGNLIGKRVEGIDATGTTANGQVQAVQVKDRQVYLELDTGAMLPMGNITAIAQGAAAAVSSGA